ncbi:hypothetical protein BGZ60DRAFT_403552 [Tricladium varicosporioides]|nr:hypothetical protein BGZ60DRAFT_403552 [Hymenoscyphus varicosporioides]
MTCAACNTIPPVVSEGYEPKGEYITLSGLKTYVTGPANAKKGLICLYDVFGFAPQTLQGADLLSQTLNTLVVLPDILAGRYAQATWFHELIETGPEVEKTKAEFMAYAMDFVPWAGKFYEVMKDAKSKWSGVESWGAYGLCWGGKVTALSSAKDTHFKASGQVHPGRLMKADAEAITIPHIVLASMHEPAEAVADYKEVIMGEGKKGIVETYPTSVHGWMGARADLKEGTEELKEYIRGYNQLAKFFSEHL